MTSLERVIAALERRQPDRVPYFECVIDQRVMQALLPGCDYFQFNDWLGLDNAGQNRSSWSRDNVEYIDKARGLFRDKWGVIRAFGPESTPAPIEGPIKRPEDLKTYTPPDPEADDVLGGIPEVVARYKGEEGHHRDLPRRLLQSGLPPRHRAVPHGHDRPPGAGPRAGRDHPEPRHPRHAADVAAGVDVVVFGDDYADKNSTAHVAAALPASSSCRASSGASMRPTRPGPT